MFADLHRFFSRILPKDESLKFLEIGAFPGSYMWYFNKFFGYQVSGLEYVDWCCDQAKELLRKAGVHSDIIHGDLFEYSPSLEDRRWDVVASFGFIEHFQNITEVIKLHLNLLKRNGYLLLVIPNHQGLYGRILKRMDYESYRTHNMMSYEDLYKALVETHQIEILEGGYYGHLGFWNCGLYSFMKVWGKLPYILVRSPLYLLEHIGQLIPNSIRFSPNMAVIARKVN